MPSHKIQLLKPAKPVLHSSWKLYVDAALDGGNPSATAAIGLVLTCYNKDVGTEYVYDMRSAVINGSSISNNVAEMRAILYGYQYAERYLCGEARLYSDSRYSVNSINNRVMHTETPLTWTNVNSHRASTALELHWLSRNDTMMGLADFLAMLSVTSCEDFRWGKHDDQQLLLDAYSTYQPKR